MGKLVKVLGGIVVGLATLGILANMPDTTGYPGNHAYWQEDYQKMAKK